jgi:hypothetical protein
MSIELDVKLSRPNLRVKDVIDSISSAWAALSIIEAPVNIEELTEGSDSVISGTSPPISISVDYRASVRCDFYFVDGEDDDSECGLWGVVAIGVRNEGSMFLMAVVATALAKAADSEIVDEARLLKGDRVHSVFDLEELTSVSRGCSFDEAVRAFALQIT